MKDLENTAIAGVPILFPYQPEQFWDMIRQVIREEITKVEKQKPPLSSFETPGLVCKPLYKMAEVCILFDVTRPTIYDWIKHGKLKPFKVRSRIFFLAQDIQQLMNTDVNSRIVK
jgi:predicted DNA-binding transcriptional regulator AlpA